MNEQMMDGMMNGTMMQICMIASTLFALIALITLVVQAVLQAKILRELRGLRADRQQFFSREMKPGWTA